MATQYPEISDKHQHFISQQKVFFVATAASDGRVNISPKGIDSFRIIDNKKIIWLNLTGSGNETSAHVQQNSRMTIMFSAFEGSPSILRLYGNANVIHQKDPEWDKLISKFETLPGARQIFEMNIDLVQTSCGTGVPLFDFVSDRKQLTEFALKKGEQGLKEYWINKNQHSIDGKPTNIVDKNI